MKHLQGSSRVWESGRKKHQNNKKNIFYQSFVIKDTNQLFFRRNLFTLEL